jgi:cell division protein FtsB
LFGYFLAKQGAGSQRKPASLASISDKKLENEVLKDQVKQLESKIKTLEKALDMTK